MENHAKYLNSWIKVLKDDKKAIFKASALAQKAVTLVESYSQPADEKAA
jgi:antirestriction protein ArdC